jgi:hypothetical protein
MEHINTLDNLASDDVEPANVISDEIPSDTIKLGHILEPDHSVALSSTSALKGKQ